MSRPLGCARRSVPIGPQWQPGSIGRALGAFPWIQQSLALTWRQNEMHALPRASSQISTLRSSIRFAAGAAPPKPRLGDQAGGAGSRSASGASGLTTVLLRSQRKSSRILQVHCAANRMWTGRLRTPEFGKPHYRSIRSDLSVMPGDATHEASKRG